MNLLDSYGTTKDRYLELIHEFPLRPLRSNADLNAAIRVLTQLHDQPSCDPAERDYADVLGELIDRYQEAARKRNTFSGGDVLQFLMESRDLTSSKLASDVGIGEKTITDVIAGSGSLSLEETNKLATYFKVLPSAFTPTA